MRFRFIVGFTVVLLSVAALAGCNYGHVTATLPFAIRPTLAPSPTPGKPNTTNPTPVPLAVPLTTEEQAIDEALRMDASMATWDEPWSKDTLRLDPSRISLQAFPNLTAEAEGNSEEYSPELVTEAGAVWRITITGTVQLSLPGSGDAKYDGVTYVISQRLGGALTIRSGNPIHTTIP